MPSPHEILKQYWGFSEFRGEQENIITAVLQGKDVLALLPTGGGKSVCFQVPTMLQDGMCLVVTPLIALMKDQVEHLQNRGISAFAIHSGLSQIEVENAFENAIDGAYKFLYISPERIETKVFQAILDELNICLLAVDEAHCISQWGYDFRPPYLRIAQIRKSLPHIPVLALTASATPIVQQDIIDKLQFDQFEVFKQSFRRPNIAYAVESCDNKLGKLFDLFHANNGCGIVYCKSRRLTQDIAKFLNLQQINADFYHAGLSQEERNAKQQNWMTNRTRVIVCTNAFGMGIDKPDVRLVVHYNAPDCLENYYQEAGRAGRDGMPSKAVLLYQDQDIQELKALPEVRFPFFEVIKNVYQQLGDFLHIPVGSGEECFYDFDLNTFIKNFHLDAIQTIYAIKALEQAGFISFNESIFLPSKVTFTTDKERLYSFEESHPEYEEIIKCLLRTYEGIFSNRVSVFENQLSRILHLGKDKIVGLLNKLQHHGIIEYLPQKDTPQILYLNNRAPKNDLLFNHEEYLKRKKIFEDRINKMLDFIDSSACRSVFISNYFGERNAANCGVCDNCTKEKSTKTTVSDFKTIAKAVKNLLNETQISSKELIQLLSQYPAEKIYEVLKYLQQEEVILIDELGMVKLL